MGRDTGMIAPSLPRFEAYWPWAMRSSCIVGYPEVLSGNFRFAGQPPGTSALGLNDVLLLRDQAR